MRGLASAVVVIVAVVQVACVGLFALLSISGDSLGIALGMALLLSVPFVLGTLPAIVLLRNGQGALALWCALGSVFVTLLLWASA